MQFGNGPEPIVGGAAADVIKDGDTNSFMADVIEASNEAPVIVDFWAPWCGPCKQLTPLLEKAVTAARGAVRLVKINIDENQAIAAQLRIQSIPAVIAFKNGQPVDGFMGAVPESQIKAFIDRLSGDQGPSPVDQALEQAKQMAASGDLASAAQIFAAVLQEEPGQPKALAGLAECYLANGDKERAAQTLALAPPDAANDPDILSAKAKLDLAGESVDDEEVANLKATVEANPADHQARFGLAMALHGAGKGEQAMDELLEIVKRDRKWNDEAARKQLVKLFEAYGPTHELTVAGRKRLSSILFS